MLKRTVSGIRCSSWTARALSAVPVPGAVVLRYHSVNDDPRWRRDYIQGSLAVPPDVFDRQMCFLKERHVVVGIGELADMISSGARMDRRLAAVTFDDGYEDNYRNALPILKRHGLTAAFYVTTGTIADASVLWTVRLRHAVRTFPGDSLPIEEVEGRSIDVSCDAARERAIRLLTGMVKRCSPAEADRLVAEIAEACGEREFVPDIRVIMDESEIKTLARAGMTVGAHTVNHYNLTCLETKDIAFELRESRRVLEAVTGAPVEHLAYPDGRTGRHFDGRVARVAMEEGYRSAVTSISGPASSAYPVWSIPRLGVVPSYSNTGRLAVDMQRARISKPRGGVFDEVRRETGGDTAGR